MNEPFSSAHGIALLCDMQGQILECLHDDLRLCPQPLTQTSLTQLIDRGSMRKALSFLAELRAQGAVFGWELNVPIADGVTSLHFAGFLNADTMLIVGAKTNHGLQTLYKELMQINNEQMNTLRTSIKTHADLSKKQEAQEQDLYEEIARLNNELVAMQRELVKKNAQLKQLNEQKNQFLGMAAHDLRNPLHVLLSFSEFLLEEGADELDGDYIKILTTIQKSSEFMTRLVNDLLDVAKIESGKLELHRKPTNLSALVQQNIDLNRLIASNKDIEIQLSVEPLPDMWLDPDKIEQVLNNLLSNAVKYSHPQSTIHVQIEQEDRHALLTVEDEGQGIPAEELDGLFTPFQRASARGTAGEKGTGLGLVIVKRIVEGHQGKIWMESEVDVGTTVFVSLPLDNEA